MRAEPAAKAHSIRYPEELTCLTPGSYRQGHYRVHVLIAYSTVIMILAITTANISVKVILSY